MVEGDNQYYGDGVEVGNGDTGIRCVALQPIRCDGRAQYGAMGWEVTTNTMQWYLMWYSQYGSGVELELVLDIIVIRWWYGGYL